MLRAMVLLGTPSGLAVPKIPKSLRDHVRHLRNALEHWDNTESPARRELKALAGEEAESYGFGPDDALIAGLSEGELYAAASEVHVFLRELETTTFVWKGAAPNADEDRP